MEKLKKLFSNGQILAGQAANIAADAGQSARDYWDKNKDDLQAQGMDALKAGKEYVSTTCESVAEAASGIYQDIKYSDSELNKLQQNIENQGGMYRELNRRSTTVDSILLGGETLATLLAAGFIPDDIIEAYNDYETDVDSFIEHMRKCYLK